MQRVILRRLLLTHPDPLSFSRAEKIRNESSSDLLLLDASLLKALLNERLAMLQQLHRRAAPAAGGGGVAELDPFWKDILDGLCELDVLAWALSMVLERGK